MGFYLQYSWKMKSSLIEKRTHSNQVFEFLLETASAGVFNGIVVTSVIIVYSNKQKDKKSDAMQHLQGFFLFKQRDLTRL